MKGIFRRLRPGQLLISIRSSLWFVPAVFVVAAVFLAVGLVELDQQFDTRIRDAWPHFFATEAEGARGMLSAIASSMATVAGVVFSITIVTLTLASTQYTPRVLRNFMRDRNTQFALGTLVGAYIYCLLVLRSISSGDYSFVPSLAVLGGVVWAVAAIGFIIFFIHHISTLIQASEIAAAVTRDTLRAIERLFPEQVGDSADEDAPPAAIGDIRWQPVPARAMGYIQAVEPEMLIRFAKRHGTVLRMECGIGDFVAPGRPLASLALERPPGEAIIAEVNAMYAIGSYRTIEQDAAFGVRQLVDIALKALSPGINDTTTAVDCIEHLAAVLCCCARRRIATRARLDGGELRVIAVGPTFAGLVSLSFDQILEHAQANTEIIVRMLAALEQVSRVTDLRCRLDVLERQGRLIVDTARDNARPAHALEKIDRQFSALRQALQGPPAPALAEPEVR